MNKILWLCSWYPNNIDPFDGDFVQRHAQAASLSNRIHVIKLTPDVNAKAVTKVTRTFQQWPNLKETFIYYPKPKSLIGKTVAYLRWYSLYKYAIDTYVKENGLPDLLHVHIPYKAGTMAQQVKRKYNVPYVVTEHWGGYNDIVPRNYKQREPRFKSVVKDTFKKSLGLHSVSDYLGERINHYVTPIDVTVIPNAVNTEFFKYDPVPRNEERFNIIHISNGAPAKNLNALLEVLSRLDENLYSVTILGLPKEKNENLQNLYPGFLFQDPLPNQLVAHYLNMADLMVMFSHIENSPCVIGESLCCGVPVIATNVGGIPELINESNGFLIAPGDGQQMIEAIEKIRLNPGAYDRNAISENAIEKYNYKKIGSDIDKWYYKTLAKSKTGA